MRVQFNLFGLFLASSLARADVTLNLTQGVTPLSHDIYSLHMLILWVCVGIGLLVFGVMLYSMIYHRKASGFKAVQFHESLKIELLWTIIPLLILILLAIPATQVLIQMNDTGKEDITIKITGHQWYWEYEYLNEKVHLFSHISPPISQLNPKDPNYLRTVDHVVVVPIHKKIRFLMTSHDVIHSWWVPDLGVKRDALPGFINEAWARIDRAGTYYGQCTELCGMDHAFMPIVVVAVSDQTFQHWVAQQTGQLPVQPAAALPTTPAVIPAKPTATPAAAPTTTATATATATAKTYTMAELKQKGEQVFMSICAACHQPTGEGMPPTFPALNGSPIVNGPVDAHINRVMNGKPGTAMQAFKDQLSDEEIASVITYERNSWNNKTGTIVQPSDITAARKKFGATPP